MSIHMDNSKQYRVLEIFFRALKGEDIRIADLAKKYSYSEKTISRLIKKTQ